MKKLLEEYYKHVEKSFHPGSYSKDMYEILFLSRLNSWALQFNPIIIGPNNIQHPMSLISLVLSGSGSGKDAAIKFLDPIERNVEEMCKSIFNQKRDFLLAQDEIPDPDGINFTVSKKRERKKPLAETLAPEHIPWFKSATEAGTNMYYSTYSAIGFGSIGLSSTEFGQDFQKKGFLENLEKVLELWDSPSKTASRITNEKGAIVFEGVQSGCSMHGSFDEFKKNDNMIDHLQTYLATTMARRALFCKISDEENLKFFEMQLKENEKKSKKFQEELLSKEEKEQEMEMNETNEHIEKLIDIIYESVLKKYAEKFINHNIINNNGNIDRPEIIIRLDKGAERLLHFYQTAMDREVLSIIKGGRISDKRLRIEIRSRHLKAMRIAGMSAFFNKRSLINEDDVKYGVSVVQKSGKYFEEISKPSIVVDEICTHLSKTTERVTVRDLEAAEIIPIGMAKYRLNDLWERCAEELYQQNKIFRSTMNKGNMIQRIWIENLVETEGDIAHISYSTEESQADSYMKTISVPIHSIMDIPDIKKIATGGFKDNSRSINNIEALGNVLIYDIDDGELTVSQCKDIFYGMCGFVYPTKSHMKPKLIKTGEIDPMSGDFIKKEKICERFRIVLLCKQHFPFGEDKAQSNEEYKTLYSEVALHFGIPFDQNTRDSSRFFWVTEEAKKDNVRRMGKFNGDKKIDLTHFMPNLKIHNDIQSKSKVFDSKQYWENMSIRDILEKCVKDSIIKESRNCALFSMAMNLKDKGLGYDEIERHVLDVNNKFDKPLDEKEMQMTVLSTLKKRIENV